MRRARAVLTFAVGTASAGSLLMLTLLMAIEENASWEVRRHLGAVPMAVGIASLVLQRSFGAPWLVEG